MFAAVKSPRGRHPERVRTGGKGGGSGATGGGGKTTAGRTRLGGMCAPQGVTKLGCAQGW